MAGRPRIRGFSREVLRAVVQELQYIMEHGPTNINLGVCHNLHVRLMLHEDMRVCGYTVVNRFAQTWPKSLRDVAGDVLANFIDDTPWYVSDMWSGDVLAARTEFMQYMIDTITAELASK